MWTFDRSQRYWYCCIFFLTSSLRSSYHVFVRFIKIFEIPLFSKIYEPIENEKTIDLFTTNCNFYSFAIWYACRYSIHFNRNCFRNNQWVEDFEKTSLFVIHHIFKILSISYGDSKNNLHSSSKHCNFWKLEID